MVPRCAFIAARVTGLRIWRRFATAAEQINAKTFTIDGEAVVLEPDGLSRFEELNHRKDADTAILYAFDLIEHDGEDMRNRPFLDRKNALARLLRNTKARILFNEHIAEDGPIVFAHACRLGAEGIVSKKVDGPYRSGPCRVWIKVRNPATSPCSGRGARFGIDEPEAARAGDDPPPGTKPPAARGARAAILMRRSIAQKAASRLHRVGHCILATLHIAAI
jgi:bifunctional non-homologous end joining protein LigD